MALLSDIDWTILLAVAAFFVLGKEGGTVVRQIGRVYGRVTRLKTELMDELAKAAELPPPAPGGVPSLRRSILDWETTPGRASGIPVAVAAPPVALAARADPPATPYYAMGLGPSTWSVSLPSLDSGPRSGP